MRIAIIGTVLLLGAGSANAEEGAAIGFASVVNGEVAVQHADKKGTWETLKPGAQVHQGDFIKTADGRAQLTFQDKSSITLAPKSQVELNEFVYKPNSARQSVFKLWGGRLRAKVSKFMAGTNDVRVTTPTAVAGVRGTELMVSLQDSSGNVLEGEPGDNPPGDANTNVVVFEGKVGLKGTSEGSNEVSLGAGDSSNAGPGGPGDVSKLNDSQLRYAMRLASARSQGSLSGSIGSKEFNSTSSGFGGGTQGAGGVDFGTPPIDQQPTDANSGSTLKIRIRVPNQQ